MTGVLAGIEDGAGVDFRAVESFVGTSAGSIVAATLAVRPLPAAPARDARRPRPRTRRPSRSGARRAWPARGARGRALGLGAERPAGRHGGRAGRAGRGAGALGAAGPRAERGPAARPAARQVERSGVRFDGRLRVCCVDKAPAGASSSAPRARRPPPSRTPSSARARSRGCSRPPASAGASTSTAASGASRTSTPRRPGAAATCCAWIRARAWAPGRARPWGCCARRSASPRPSRSRSCAAAARACATWAPTAAAARLMGREPHGPRAAPAGAGRGLPPGARAGRG